MASAYAALISVMHIIEQIEHHPFPPLSLDKKQVESLTQNATFLQEFLQGYNSPLAKTDEADPLEMRIADAAYAAEDLIESHIVDRILSAKNINQRSRNKVKCFTNLFRKERETVPQLNDGELYEGLQKLTEEMDMIRKEAMEIVAEKSVVVPDQLQSKDNVLSFSAGTSKSFKSTTSMVGNGDVLLEIMDKLTGEPRARHVIPITGMGGIGKTTLARNIYAQQLIKERFDICAWVTISQEFDSREILREILSQASKDKVIREMSEGELGLELHKCLTGRMFLIVMDDMWSIEVWDTIQRFLPNNSNGSRVMVTTRLWNLASQLDDTNRFQMKFLDEASCWNLFTKTVFEGESLSFPLQLEKIGKEIVKKCRGLPLSIVVLGGLLRKMEHTKECWEGIGRKLNSVLLNSANDEHCLKILKLSYDHLPVYLKPCYLYMGVFEEDQIVLASTMINLWVAEGFLKPTSSSKSLETIGKEYLKELVDRNLILVEVLGSIGSVKYCKIHDSLRDLCLREAQKERFYHVVDRNSVGGTHISQRRIVIMGSASKEKVINALESMPHARSYICDNDNVTTLPESRLLRTWKAYERRCNETDPPGPYPRILRRLLRENFPRHKYSLRKMFELVNLRYLVVGAHKNTKLQSSINLLWNLQTLIVAHPRKITAPVEIWKMPQLRHVEFYRRRLYLPEPPSDSNIIIMENLETLKGVRNFKCSEEVLRRIPNIKKLGIEYDEVKGNELDIGDYYCLGNLELLHKLESLSCESRILEYSSYMQKLTFPHSLRKLSLDIILNCWEVMLEKIGSLPLLQKLIVMKIGLGQCGRWKWETVEGQFPSLKFLFLGFCFNLEHWTTESSHFPCLEQLHLFLLRDAQEIPSEIGEIATLQSIMLYGCSESVSNSVKKIVEEQEDLQGDQLSFQVHHLLSEMISIERPNFTIDLRRVHGLYRPIF